MGRRSLLALMTATLIFNLAAMALTIRYANGGAIVEANPVARSSVALLGNLAPMANFAVILLIYLAILRVAKSPGADGFRRLGSVVGVGLDFSALLLPIVTFLDVFNDIAVVFFRANLMTLTQLLSVTPFVALDVILVSRALSLAIRTATRPRTRIAEESA